MTTTHPSTERGQSQCDLILACLLARAGEWVPMLHLHNVSGSMNIHSRIADLRKRGHHILQQNTRQPNGATHSSYMLAPANPVAAELREADFIVAQAAQPAPPSKPIREIRG